MRRKLGIRDCDVVAVRLDTEGRDLQFGDVMVRVSPQFRLELHLDTDEANAAGVKPGDYAELVPPLLMWRRHGPIIRTLRRRTTRASSPEGAKNMAKNKGNGGVYRVTDIIGTSKVSWEDAARSAVETAAKSLRDLRVAEVTKLDMKVEKGKVVAYRARVSLSFKYEG